MTAMYSKLIMLYAMPLNNMGAAGRWNCLLGSPTQGAVSL